MESPLKFQQLNSELSHMKHTQEVPKSRIKVFVFYYYPSCLSLSKDLVARVLFPCIRICMAILVDWSPAIISLITHDSQANGLFWWSSWIFLRKKHVVFGSFGNESMQSCSVHHVVVLLALSASVSVYSPTSDSFDHRNFISCKYICTYTTSICT